jgi:hypothetical protein
MSAAFVAWLVGSAAAGDYPQPELPAGLAPGVYELTSDGDLVGPYNPAEMAGWAVVGGRLIDTHQPGFVAGRVYVSVIPTNVFSDPGQLGPNTLVTDTLVVSAPYVVVLWRGQLRTVQTPNDGHFAKFDWVPAARVVAPSAVAPAPDSPKTGEAAQSHGDPTP